MRNFGIIIIVLGILMTVLSGFSVVTREKVVDLGSIEITREEKTPIYWSPVTGGVLIATGLVMFFAGKRKW